MRSRAPTFAAVLLLFCTGTRALADEAADLNFFESKVRPLLVDACIDCHGAKKQKGGLRLDSRAAWTKGGSSGVVITPGKPDDSLLISAVRRWDSNLQMPPEHGLENAEVNDLVEWVKRGAPDPRVEEPVSPAAPVAKATGGIDLEKGRKHWAFQPVQRVALPAAQDSAWVRNEIDLFTLAQMREAGVQPAADADRGTLLRRVTYDLTGLPPSPEELAAFERDTAPDAFARVVDRLLASPQYGERWGRHWLDVVRYADTCGNASDYPIPQAYLYRNYVIDSVNRDVPFDQFIREQIAGDLLPSSSGEEEKRHKLATGYLAMARHFAGGAGEPHLTLEDAIDNVGRAFLGLSINCARCHDHKFDPISSNDYYALYGIFSSSIFPHPGSEGKSRPENLVPLIAKADAEALEKQKAEQLAAIEVEKKAADAAKVEVEKEPDGPEKKGRVEAAMKAAAAVRERREQIRKTAVGAMAYAVHEKPAGENARLQVRGDPKRLGEEVPRGFLTILGGQTLPAEEHGSGRKELAEWIATPANPLTARVIVNRLWQHHFGRGVVATPNDFGARGQPPTDPALLDFLATRFVEKGWSLKEMHRFILLSHTWQLASEGGATLAQDPEKRLWSHAERRRLEAEAIRDTMLCVSGDLDRTPGAEHPFPPVESWSFTQHKQFFALYENRKRSVYQMQQRLRKHPFFALFDGADTNASTDQRRTSTTALQSLFAMNDPFVHEQAEHFAARIVSHAASEEDRANLAFRTLYARTPEPEEVAMCREYLAALREKKGLPVEQGWISLSRVLLSANEFLYLD